MIPDGTFTLQAAKAHLRVPHADEDAAIMAMLDAAVAACERLTRRAWTRRQWSVVLDACDLEACGCDDPAVFHAELSPATATVFAGDAAVPPASYYTRTRWGHTVVVLEESGAFPADARGNVGRIDFVAAPPNDYVPPDVVAAAMLYLGDLFENREAQVIGTIVARNEAAEILLRPYVLDMHA